LFVLAAALVTSVSSMGRSEGPSCNAWEIEYALTGKLQLTDTFMGAGNGEHDLGPGKLVLQFDDVGGQPGGNVKVKTYELTNRFTIESKVVGVRTTVVNDSMTRATPDPRGVIAVGVLGADGWSRWASPWANVQTDGYLTCSGACGKFGAPPPGRSELHLPPQPIAFKPFSFSADKASFRMEPTVTEKTSSNTATLALSGRETARKCVPAP